LPSSRRSSAGRCLPHAEQVQIRVLLSQGSQTAGPAGPERRTSGLVSPQSSHSFAGRL
jgi:hypothetical protein